MKHATPAPPELGTEDGLAYALFLPESEPEVAVVICHGAGSAKESHFDFARGCRQEGMAALAFDARGHGRSEGRFGPGCLDDVQDDDGAGFGACAPGGPARLQPGRLLCHLCRRA